MKKYLNLLLVGFFLFVVGIIIFNFELVDYEFVNYLPDNFKTTVDTFYITAETDKTYRVKTAKYNENIKIEKFINNNLGDKVMIEVKHSNTSDVVSNIKNSMYKTEVTFQNEINYNELKLKDVYKLALKCITEGKVYNYNLLKYGEITIYGSEDSLSRIEYDKYDE